MSEDMKRIIRDDVDDAHSLCDDTSPLYTLLSMRCFYFPGFVADVMWHSPQSCLAKDIIQAHAAQMQAELRCSAGCHFVTKVCKVVEHFSGFELKGSGISVCVCVFFWRGVAFIQFRYNVFVLGPGETARAPNTQRCCS